MKRRYIGLIIVEAIIIMVLLIGVGVLFMLWNKSKALPALPVVPTFDPSVSVSTPVPAVPIGNQPAGVPLACDNILYPMKVGQEWLYQETTTNRTDQLNMSIQSVNDSQGNVFVKNLSTGSTKEVQVLCNGDSIQNFPFMSVDAEFFDGLGFSKMSSTYNSGILLPSESAFQANNWALSWETEYQVSGNTTLTFNGKKVNIEMINTPVKLSCQTLASGDAAFEMVTVPAGTFRALKVVCTEQGQVTVNGNGMTFSGIAEGRSNQWFVPDTGLVKMQVEQANLKVLGVSFSILTNNNFELLSFTAVP